MIVSKAILEYVAPRYTYLLFAQLLSFVYVLKVRFIVHANRVYHFLLQAFILCLFIDDFFPQNLSPI